MLIIKVEPAIVYLGICPHCGENFSMFREDLNDELECIECGGEFCAEAPDEEIGEIIYSNVEQE